MTDTPPRPSRRLLWRGVLLAILGLGLLMASSSAMPDDVTGRNDARTWLATLGIFASVGVGVAGAVMFLVGLVKRFREPRPPRDPTIKRPTPLQAVAIVIGSVALGISTCGAFATSLESNSSFAAILLVGGAVGFVASGVLFLYGVIVFVRRLRRKSVTRPALDRPLEALASTRHLPLVADNLLAHMPSASARARSGASLVVSSPSR